MARRTGRSDDVSRSSRRDLLKASAVLVAAAPMLPGTAAAQERAGSRGAEQITSQPVDPNRRILIKGGTVVSLDRQIGDFGRGDVLIQGKKIAAIGEKLEAPAA